MRTAFFLLVLANLVFFVWAQDYFGGQDEGREPQRLNDQIHPDKLKVEVPAPPPAPPPQACRRIDGLAAKDAERLRAAIQEAGLAATLQPGEEIASFWVNIPDLPNKAVADKKTSELKLFGVVDFHVMQSEGGSFVVSLGVFRNESGANELLQELVKKGVKSARIETKKAPAPARVEVRGAADLVSQRMPEWLAGAAGATVADCP